MLTKSTALLAIFVALTSCKSRNSSSVRADEPSQNSSTSASVKITGESAQGMLTLFDFNLEKLEGTKVSVQNVRCFALGTPEDGEYQAQCTYPSKGKIGFTNPEEPGDAAVVTEGLTAAGIKPTPEKEVDFYNFDENERVVRKTAPACFGVNKDTTVQVWSAKKVECVFYREPSKTSCMVTK